MYTKIGARDLEFG